VICIFAVGGEPLSSGKRYGILGPPVLEKTLGGRPADLEVRRAVCFAIGVFCDNRRPRFGTTISLFGLADFLLRFELRQSELLSHIVAAYDCIIISKAMHNETIWCGAIELDCERTIRGAMSRSWYTRFAAAHVTAEHLGDFIDRWKG
jgi:hypothetical protein